jgi:hypothetical protein
MRRWIAFIGALVLFVGCSTNKTVSHSDVQLAAGDLRTLAASTQMLMEQCARGGATSTFCSEQAEMISEHVDTTRKDLDGDGGEVELERTRVTAGAEDLARLVAQIEQRSTGELDAATGHDLAARFAAIEDDLKKR